MAELVEARFCTVVGLKLFRIIVIYLVGDEGRWNAAHNFNCPLYKPGVTCFLLMHLCWLLYVMYMACFDFDVSFYERWKQAEAMHAEMLQFSLDEDQWEQDWAVILSIASQPGYCQLSHYRSMVLQRALSKSVSRNLM